MFAQTPIDFKYMVHLTEKNCIRIREIEAELAGMREKYLSLLAKQSECCARIWFALTDAECVPINEEMNKRFQEILDLNAREHSLEIELHYILEPDDEYYF